MALIEDATWLQLGNAFFNTAQIVLLAYIAGWASKTDRQKRGEE